MTNTVENTILLVDDNPTNIRVLYEILDGRGYKLLVAKSGEKALEIARLASPLVILLDVMMPPGMDGFEVCRRLKAEEQSKDICVIFLSALNESEVRVQGLQSGASDYLGKPFDAGEVVARVETHLALRRAQIQLAERNRSLEHELRVATELVQEGESRSRGALLGKSSRMAEVRRSIADSSRTMMPLLIVGPSGSGHEAVARAIHGSSLQRRRPFIHIDCLSARHDDVESLFGGEDGEGKWGLARGGTLFFERVEALPNGLALELARRLETGDADPACRVVCSTLDTDSPLLRSWTDDIFQRLQANRIKLPPLRERLEDLVELTEHCLSRTTARLGRPPSRVDAETQARLAAHAWPGNIDELRSVIECAVLASTGDTLSIAPELLAHAGRVGQYQLDKLIGTGGMGEVWSATHRLIARPAAVKLVRGASGAAGPTLLARFEREARATAGLESPNTVQLYDFGTTDDGGFFYVMERLRGLDLHELVKAHGPVAPERAVWFLEQACGSLAEAHAAGLVHRDIKPANLFCAIQGLEHDVLKVLDFGIVRMMDDEQMPVTEMLGTPMFMSPEACAGQPMDARGDLYALGCVAFWLVTGKTVFQAETPMGHVTQHAMDKPPAIEHVCEVPLPQEFSRLVSTLLRKQPDERPQSALEVRDELRRISFPRPWTRARASAWWSGNEDRIPAIPSGPPSLQTRGPNRKM